MKKKNQSSATIMLRSLMLMVSILTFVFAFAILLATGHQLLEETQANSDSIITSLKKAEIDGNDDWEAWRRNSTLNTSTSYVFVRNNRKDAKVKYYYSPRAKKLLSVKPIELPINNHLYYRPHFGLLFRRTGHARGIYYTLWLSMNAYVALLLRIMLVTLIVLVLTLIVSPLYIRGLAKRLTDPLKSLSIATRHASTASGSKRPQLPVPNRPSEVTEVAQNFNRLLTQLVEREEQQKLFVSNAAHELRTPIATIRSHAQLIERRGQEHPEIINKSIGYIDEGSHQMETLVENLLTLSRADRLTYEQSDYDLSTSLATIVTKIQPAIPQTIVTHISEAVHIIAHADSIEKIITNFLNNASKYSPADTTITVTLNVINGVPALSVIDEGPGISAEDKQHIFERFYRGSETRGTIAGTGLGMAIAKQLADVNHATITIEDNHPTGSIFTLSFEQLAESKKSF